MSRFKKIDILKIGDDFRGEIMQQLGSLGEGKAILKQILKTINGNDDYNKTILVAQLNVFCTGSARRCKLLRHRLGEEGYKKLIELGLYNYEGHPVSEIKEDIDSLRKNIISSFQEISEKLNCLR